VLPGLRSDFVLEGTDPKTSLGLQNTKFGLELLADLGSNGARNTIDRIGLVNPNEFWHLDFWVTIIIPVIFLGVAVTLNVFFVIYCTLKLFC
jgi:hypothetical protein